MSWNPKTYLAFADARTRPAAELLSRIGSDAPERIADLGCGPGNSTALLASRWPGAEIDGIDSSPDMIAAASQTVIPAHWVLRDIENWTPDQNYDVIFSNATFQWLDHHETLLPRLMRFVKPGGYFAFQMPRNFDAPSHQLMVHAAASGPWADKLSNLVPRHVGPPEFYYEILSARPKAIDIWETSYLQVLDGDDPVFRWTRSTGLRPYEQALEGDAREGFLDAYRMLLRQAYPRREDGKTLFPFKRLFAVARV